MKINSNHFIAGCALLFAGLAIRLGFLDTDLGVGEDLVVFVTGLVYLLLGFGLRPVNRFTFLSTLCVYLSLSSFLAFYIIRNIAPESGMLVEIIFISPLLVLLLASLVLLIIGIVYPVFKNKSQV